MFKDAEVEELAEHQGFEAVSPERVAVIDYLAALQDPSCQSRRRCIQNHHIHPISPQVRGNRTDGLESSLKRIYRLIQVHGHIHIAEGPELASRASENVGKDYVGARPDRPAECLQPPTDIRGKGSVT